MSLDQQVLKLFAIPRVDNRQFAVIGLGRFGRAVCETLKGEGCDVFGIDNDKQIVDQVLNDSIVTHALQLDATNPKALKEAGVFEFHTVIVAIGYVKESVITVLHLKDKEEKGAKEKKDLPYVIAKASGKIHGQILERVGADRVVFPEHDSGCALAYSLTHPAILKQFELEQNHRVAEIAVPDAFDGKTIVELKLRSRFNVNVLAVKQQGEVQITPDPNLRLSQGAVMLLIGTKEDIERLPL